MAKKSGKQIIVTGADGFIGSHLCEALVADGYRVRALVWYNAFGRAGWLDSLEPSTLDSIDIVTGDIRDPHQMLDLLDGAETVFHLAALIGVPYSYHAPDSYIQTNVTGTTNLLQAAKRRGVARFVHTSTSEVYGTAQSLPMAEEHPLVGQSPYAASKIAADQMVTAFHRSFELPTVTVRPFNTYGPRQSLRAVIPSIVIPALDGESEIALGSLTPERDFTFVSDTVAGLMKAARADGAVGQTVNLGTNVSVSIGKIVEKVSEIAGRKLSAKQDSSRVRPDKSEVDKLQCDASKARSLLSWEPQVTLEEGLRRVWDWFAEPTNRAYFVHRGYTL